MRRRYLNTNLITAALTFLDSLRACSSAARAFFKTDSQARRLMDASALLGSFIFGVLPFSVYGSMPDKFDPPHC